MPRLHASLIFVVLAAASSAQAALGTEFWAFLSQDSSVFDELDGVGERPRPS